MNKYVFVTAIVEIPEKEYRDWSEQSDVTFHGGPGDIHNPEKGIYVIGHSGLTSINDAAFNGMKHSIFTEEGGV